MSHEDGASLLDAEFLSAFFSGKNDLAGRNNNMDATAKGHYDDDDIDMYTSPPSPQGYSELCDMLLHAEGLDIVPHCLDMVSSRRDAGCYSGEQAAPDATAKGHYDDDDIDMYTSPSSPQGYSELCDMLLHAEGLDIVPRCLDMVSSRRDAGCYSGKLAAPKSHAATAYSIDGVPNAFTEALNNLGDELMHLYFRKVHPLLPVVDEHRFYLRYGLRQAAHLQQPDQSLVFYSMMFVAFGHLNNEQLQRTSVSSIKEGQKRLFSLVTSLYSATVAKMDPDQEVALTQAALLLSYWTPSYASKEVDNFWINESLKHVLAVRASKSQGSTSSRHRLLWWCYTVRNRLSSFILRRPDQSSSSSSAKKLTLEDFRGDLSFPGFTGIGEKTRMVKAFISLCDLTNIMAEVLKFSQQQREGQDFGGLNDKMFDIQAEKRLEKIASLEMDLTMWQREFERENEQIKPVDRHNYEKFHLNMIRVIYRATISSLYEPFLASRPYGIPTTKRLRHVAIKRVKESSTRIASYVGQTLEDTGIENFPIPIGAWIALPIAIHLVEINRLNPSASAIHIFRSKTATAVSTSLHRLRPLMRVLHGLLLRFEGAEFISQLIDAVIRTIGKVLRQRCRSSYCANTVMEDNGDFDTRSANVLIRSGMMASNSWNDVQVDRENSPFVDGEMGLQQGGKQEPKVTLEEGELLGSVSKLVWLCLSNKMFVELV